MTSLSSATEATESSHDCSSPIGSPVVQLAANLMLFLAYIKSMKKTYTLIHGQNVQMLVNYWALPKTLVHNLKVTSLMS